KLSDAEFTDFPDLEPFLFDLKLIPESINICIPQFFTEERAGILQKREVELISKSAKEIGPENKIVFPILTIEDAVLIIQRNERGRQGSIRAKYMKDLKIQEEQDVDLVGIRDKQQIEAAVTKIQKNWRGYLVRKQYEKDKRKEEEFLGMRQTLNATQKKIAEENFQRRKNLQIQHEEEYQQALTSIKEKIRKVEGPEIKEWYQDCFRQWYMDYRREFSSFPNFPEPEEWKQPGFKFGQKKEDLKGLKADQELGSTMNSNTSAKPKDSKPSTGSAKKGKESEEIMEGSNQDVESRFLKTLLEKNSEYLQLWKDKDESENFIQKHDVEIIKTEKRVEIDSEMKDELFQLLKDELENLKLVMEKDSKKKKKDAGKKKKKEKKSTAKKGKKEKDLTGGKPIEELVDELINAGLMQRPTKHYMHEYLGQYNFLVKNKMNVEQSLLDIKRVITEYAILPLGLESVDDSVKLPHSILLFGPTGVGKTLLMNIIATETGASVFILTPRVTAGQYVGKANVSRMVYTVFKVAKAMAPSLIFIDEAESIFCKKLPKEDTSDPKRIRKDLVKAIHNLKSNDRVLVLGNSRNPFYSDAKALSDAFQKMIYVPRPAYASRELMWRTWIFHALPLTNLDHIDCSVLAKASAGMTGASIKATIDRVLTSRRIHQIPSYPLKTNEFLHFVLQLPEPDPKVEQDFKEYALKLPMNKKREVLLGLVPSEPTSEAPVKATKKKK
ncbi:Dynein regulatory complex protein 11, partial [Coelomomyces lativittatus]